MKRFSLLFFLFLISTFHAFAQTHFITAGQTQGMIFTDYVPDAWSFGAYGNQVSCYDYLDVNNDDLNDIEIYSFTDMQHSIFNAYARPLSDSIQLKSQIFYFGSQINNDSVNWTTSYYYFSSDIGFTDSSYYLAGRYLAHPDTLLFYIHSGYNIASSPLINYKRDQAIEGHDSTIIISFVNGLSPSNVSISPNPFTNQINISTEKPFQYTITDYAGRLLLSGTSDKTIATETIPAGSYLLTIKNEEVLSVKKMVKVD